MAMMYKLAKVMKVYTALQETLSEVEEEAPQPTRVDKNRCAWVNSRVLLGCSDIPTPQSSNTVIALEGALRCSQLGAEPTDYGLCSNI